MTHVGVVYFKGPKTLWSQAIDDSEVIARFSGPWLWLVRMQTINAFSSLDPERCGYVLTHENVTNPTPT